MFVVVLAKSNQQIQKISRKAQILRRRRRSNAIPNFFDTCADVYTERNVSIRNVT
jgi:hypothetical protein